ncbi:AEC family transporter [Devosia albogilva]|uniref:AEC family transporter n=1 Tax=Devosia albogilva TaxID=429726 RepID=A0ABW5QLV1_9HYPH
MLAIVNVIAPIFALMALGYFAVRLRAFPAEGIRGLIAFVNNFATPCLLFYSLINSDLVSAFNIAIIAPYYIGAIICFVAGILLAVKLFGNRPGEAVSAGFSAMFTNTVLIGLPIIQRAYGAEALPVTLSIIGLHGAILLTLAMLTMEFMRRDGQSLGKTMAVALRRVGSNPLIWGIAAGMIGYFSGLELIEPADAFFLMMMQAVVPVALFGIGGALNEYRLSDSWRQAVVASVLKLILHPLIAYVLMVPVLGVPIEIARYGILLSAMPPGVNIYVFATYYNRGVSVAANTILIATLASAVTVSVWLYILGA